MSYIYKKRMGPRILPCGTPHTICILWDKEDHEWKQTMFVYKWLKISNRNDLEKLK